MRDELAGLALLRDRALAGRDAGAVDEDALDAVRGPRLRERRVDRGLVGDVGLAEHAADLARDGLPALGVHVEDRDLGAGAASIRAVASPRPEAPPVTTAAIELSSFIPVPPFAGSL